MFAQLRAQWAQYVSPILSPRRRGSALPSPPSTPTPTPSRDTIPITPKDKVQSGRVQKQKAFPLRKSKLDTNDKLSDTNFNLPVTPKNRAIPLGEGYESSEGTLVPDATPGDDDVTMVGTPSGVEGVDYVDVDPERTRREKALDEIAHGDWTAMEVNLWTKLNIRGFEPLLPSNWQMDFPTCPNNLFTANKSRAFIHSANGNDFRGKQFLLILPSLSLTTKGSRFSAIKALFSLFTLGARARDRLKVGLLPEQVLVRCIRSYVKWSLEDSDLHHRDYIPALVVVAKGPSESTKDIVARCQSRIHALGQRYREQDYAKTQMLVDNKDAIATQFPESTILNINPTPLSKTGEVKIKQEEVEDETETFKVPAKIEKSTKEPITLYGIIVAHTIVCFVSYDISFPGKAPRTLAIFDFSDPEQDVWNAFAVAIMVIWARNFLLSQHPQVVESSIEIVDPDL